MPIWEPLTSLQMRSKPKVPKSDTDTRINRVVLTLCSENTSGWDFSASRSANKRLKLLVKVKPKGKVILALTIMACTGTLTLEWEI